MKKIVLVATGGTIAGVSNGSGYDSGVLPAEALLKTIKGLQKDVVIEAVQCCNVGSQDMDFPILQNVAQQVQLILDRSDVDGVVITHGTDTMEESCFFFNLVINSRKPIVFTGAMKPASSDRPDGPKNLTDSLSVASSDAAIGRGVLLVMNSIIHDAHSCVKSHTTSVDTFISTEYGPVGTIAENGSVHFICDSSRLHTFKSKLHSALFAELPRVDVFYGCTQMSSDILTASVGFGAKGIVLAGVGNGNLSQSVLSEVGNLVSRGIPVVRGSRVSHGRVIRNVEINDDEVGTYVSDFLSVAKARVLLMTALSLNISPCNLQQLFYDY